MKYNDFQILNNEQYYIINQEFSNNEEQDKKTIINSICEELNKIVGLCFSLSNQHNQHINKEIDETINTLVKIKNNLIETFNLKSATTINIVSTNIFSILKMLSSLSTPFLRWVMLETKTYYKSLAQNCFIDLTNCLNKILEAIEKSNIKLFKHM